jgi:NADH:ubiquinone oxidoreductase subunit 5 (subunit L)/multisubunit Na+/H+ antiporter MnhA subunit
MTELLLICTLGLPVVAALFFCALGPRRAGVVSWVGPLVPLVSLGAVVWLSFTLPSGPEVVVLADWIPSLGVRLDFLLDGLSLFYALVVTGIGVLVFFYAVCYFGFGDERLPRFFACLSLFMAAMLGTVLSNNLLVMFVFWEMTGIASYLLIGFDHQKEASRAGARMALLVTMTTGLCLLCGVVLLGLAGGTFSLQEITKGPISGFPVEGWTSVVLVLVVLGALGKSAQFPFHFWLPNAMAAPTPVSAYLHSATMVKLGVFLVARFYPVFREHELWFPLLAGVSFSTMLIAAWMAFRSTDLKAILAFSTVSQLGFLIGFYGLGSSIGLRFDFVHITSHVLYKACLFMVVGIVDHATHIRDIRQLGGLRHRLPWLAVVCFIGCASMAGVPGTLGFISKELMLVDLRAGFGGHPLGGPLLVVLVVLASMLKVAFAARLFFHTFCGPEPEGVRAHFHHPGKWIQVPPMFLAGATVFLGLFPGMVEKPLDLFNFASVHAPDGGKLSLWHGFTLELMASLGIMIMGAVFYFLREKRGWSDGLPEWARWDRFFEAGVSALPKKAALFSAVMRAGRPLDYLPLLLGFLLLTSGAYLAGSPGAPLRGAVAESLNGLSFSYLRIFTAVLICGSALMVALLRGWIAQLLALSAVGLLTTFYYVLYRAPDLALTQILVESATLVGVLLLLSRFPRSAEAGEMERLPGRWRQGMNLCLAVGVGTLVAVLAAVAMVERPFRHIGPDFLQATVPLAKGTNAVNTILIDFRGFDTLGEITVLLVAVLGGVGLLMRYRRTEAEWKAGRKGPGGFGLARPPAKEGAR